LEGLREDLGGPSLRRLIECRLGGGLSIDLCEGGVWFDACRGGLRGSCEALLERHGWLSGLLAGCGGGRRRWLSGWEEESWGGPRQSRNSPIRSGLGCSGEVKGVLSGLVL